MIRRILLLFLCVFLLAGCSAPSAEQPDESVFTFTDDTGTEISVPYEPQTVAVLTSSLADLWITAGGNVDITVGETVERGFVDANVLLVDDGAGKTVNLERLVAAQPDLVLYSSDLSGQAECAQALLDVVSDVTLRHGSADIERHCRSNILGCFTCHNDASDLRSVAVDDRDLISHTADLCNVFTCFLNYFQLSFRSCGTFACLQRVSAQRDYDFTFAF